MPAPHVYRTDAIILRRSDLGEADRILTVYTPHLGKLRAIAKGVRKPGSRKAGHLEPFTRVALQLDRGRDLLMVSQAETIESQLRARELAEEKLRLSSMLSLVFNSISGGVIAVDTEFTITHINRKAAEMLGITRKTLYKKLKAYGEE